jgi:hypothetical protein
MNNIPHNRLVDAEILMSQDVSQRNDFIPLDINGKTGQIYFSSVSVASENLDW